ncbi:ras-related protein rab-11b [Plasmopara halstedii]|uniref:Ras-related protein rab-11b n=1 Tax=Plasmopara halstedii TaxID=4781 RepID=A0A0P1B1E5_PLAHL|nr:ras-related protein rab-11b [Plasmopara halstedii]CEG48502.1 ras-related protein rab-11b [Plasmopara halstedii]|eukprot:XP_024584871.1 ras-related protein rab-11b [Plasmopara halstedii]
MADYTQYATPFIKSFFSSIDPLIIFDDVEHLTLHEFLRDFYTRKGLLHKLEDVDALVENYGHQLDFIYAELDKKYGTKFSINPPPVVKSRQTNVVGSSLKFPRNERNSGVGKTSLIFRLQNSEFYEKLMSTIDAEFLTYVAKVDNVDVKAQIWDTAGQERFQATLSTFCNRPVAGALLVFDVGNHESWLDVERWLHKLLNVAEHGLYVTLVGNKCDLANDKRAVESEEARRFADEHHMLYFETSAKTGENVKEVFNDIIAATHRARPTDN